ncbi:MAG: hypothetical protein JWM53_1670 [bacterium]|nr:hypothetical protein [bacterium]
MKSALPLMLLFAATPALAQGSPSNATSTPSQPNSTNDETAAIARDLGLDAATAAAVAQTIAKYQAQLDPIRQSEQQTVQTLQQELAAAQPDPARLTQLANQLTSDRQQAAAIDTQRLAELQQELTPAQFAKLLLHHHHGTRPGRMPQPQGATTTPPQP